MLTTISEKLVQIAAERRMKHKWELQLADYEKEQFTMNKEIEHLTEQLKREEKDVKKLEGLSITNLIQSLTGKKYENLEREKQEVVAVKLKLEEAKKTKKEIEEAIKALHHQLEKGSDIENRYHQILLEKESQISEQDSVAGERLLQLSEEEGDLAAFLDELKEAITAGEYVLSALNQAENALSEAESWGTLDMFGGGAASGWIKHDYIDKSTNHIHEAQTRMRTFQKELLDVEEDAELRIDISDFLKFADFFFDDFISDWLVQEKIEKLLENIRTQKDNVIYIKQNLIEQIEEKETVLHGIKKEKENLILNY
ncbi:hypothetical protein D8M04_04970 [Oceanobacillus piezotolerans]|uniref:Uncharacterized protein n=1 Tax=Oceanobacillus piezotolerans TaxID=2448030 RepID=A0A498D865_9BACI|nr:hypothetical protein [Oceanobacillus piezotolerans]RLL46563.1 hypothetical protein D8M04_04970 [Oceanobacillus piezotolerans]